MPIIQQTVSLSRKTLFELSKTYQSKQSVQISVELAMSLLAIIVFGLFAVKPTLVTIGELRTTIEDKKAVILGLETKINNLDQAKVIYEAEESRLRLLNIAIPESPSVGTEIRQIEGIAKKNNITVTGLSFEEVSLVGEIEVSLEFLLNASGDYVSLISFWTDMEQMRRPVVNSSASIETLEENEAGQINFTIGGKTPYYKVDNNI